MTTLIKKVPVPLSGVMLGCAALGNLLQSYSPAVRYVFGGISAALLLLLVLKLALYPGAVREDLKNPIMMSVAATFPMGIMLLSVYAKPFLGKAAFFLWLFAIALHVVLIVAFTLRFIRKPEMPKVFASYFVVYVGIAAAGITAPAYQMQALGTAAFWFGLLCFAVLLGLVGYRYIKYPKVPEPAQPVFCIFAAPASLCLAAYLQSLQVKHTGMVVFLAVVASALYVMSLIKLVSLIRLPFYPSKASFTFPFVISAIALKQTAGYFATAGTPVPLLSVAATVETVIATLLVCYTLVCFAIFLLTPQKTGAPAKS